MPTQHTVQKTPTLMSKVEKKTNRLFPSPSNHPPTHSTQANFTSNQALVTSPNRLIPPCELAALLGVNPPPLSLAGVCGTVSGSRSI
jgi:hypothetical protein